jgi:hypothetical protein
MKVKIFEVVLHKLPSGKSPATALEEQLNEFLSQHLDLRLVTTHMSTLVAPPEPNAMPRSEESSIIIFCTLFYTEEHGGDIQPNIANNARTMEPPALCDTKMLPTYGDQRIYRKSLGAT